jgi:hypothetical protein
MKLFVDPDISFLRLPGVWSAKNLSNQELSRAQRVDTGRRLQTSRHYTDADSKTKTLPLDTIVLPPPSLPVVEMSDNGVILSSPVHLFFPCSS